MGRPFVFLQFLFFVLPQPSLYRYCFVKKFTIHPALFCISTNTTFDIYGTEEILNLCRAVQKVVYCAAVQLIVYTKSASERWKTSLKVVIRAGLRTSLRRRERCPSTTQHKLRNATLFINGAAPMFSATLVRRGNYESEWRGAHRAALPRSRSPQRRFFYFSWVAALPPPLPTARSAPKQRNQLFSTWSDCVPLIAL